jgi:hypothetical protein
MQPILGVDQEKVWIKLYWVFCLSSCFDLKVLHDRGQGHLHLGIGEPHS